MSFETRRGRSLPVGWLITLGILTLMGMGLLLRSRRHPSPSPTLTEGTLPSSSPTLSATPALRDLCAPEMLPRIHAPRFEGPIPFEQSAIAWFGQVFPTRNYTDIRVGYNARELFIYLAIFDRHL